MANSTTNIDTVFQSQSSKEITINSFFDAASPSTTYGRRGSTCGALTWGYYGGNVVTPAGDLITVANGTVSLLGASTNYVVADRTTGAVSVTTSALDWDNTTLYWKLYKVVTSATTVSSYEDARLIGQFTSIPLAGTANHNHDGVYQPYDVDLDDWAGKAAPTGTVVGTSDPQTLTNKTLTGMRETKVAMAANDISLTSGNLFTKTISGATTLTVSGVPMSGTVATFILELTNAGTNVTWWSGVKWAGGSPPTLTTTGVDILGFYTHDGGTTWRGLVLAKDSK